MNTSCLLLVHYTNLLYTHTGTAYKCDTKVANLKLTPLIEAVIILLCIIQHITWHKCDTKVANLKLTPTIEVVATSTANYLLHYTTHSMAQMQYKSGKSEINSFLFLRFYTILHAISKFLLCIKGAFTLRFNAGIHFKRVALHCGENFEPFCVVISCYNSKYFIHVEKNVAV